MITDYHAKYFAYELTRRRPSDSDEKLAGAVAGAQVDLNPHQVCAGLHPGEAHEGRNFRRRLSRRDKAADGAWTTVRRLATNIVDRHAAKDSAEGSVGDLPQSDGCRPVASRSHARALRPYGRSSDRSKSRGHDGWGAIP